MSPRREGCTILISRTRLGEEIIKGASKEGYIEVMDAPKGDIEAIINDSREKIYRSIKYMGLIL